MESEAPTTPLEERLINRLFTGLAANHIRLSASLGLQAKELRAVCESLGYRTAKSKLGEILDMRRELSPTEAKQAGYESASPPYQAKDGDKVAGKLDDLTKAGAQSVVVRRMIGDTLAGHEVWSRHMTLEQAADGFPILTKGTAREKGYQPLTYGYKQAEASRLRNELEQHKGRDVVVVRHLLREGFQQFEIWIAKRDKVNTRSYEHHHKLDVSIVKGRTKEI